MWHKAAVKEYQSLVANDVFELVERPSNKNVIKSRWVLAKKFEDGVLKKYKGRLVAKGYSQQPGIDYAQQPLLLSYQRLLYVLYCLWLLNRDSP